MAKKGILEAIDEKNHIVKIEGEGYPVLEAAWQFVPKETGTEVEYDLNTNNELRYIKSLKRPVKQETLREKADKYWKPRDPDELRSIEKQVCLKAAAEVACAAMTDATRKELGKEYNPTNFVLDMAEHFWKWIQDGGEK